MMVLRKKREINPNDGPRVFNQCISRIRKLSPKWRKSVVDMISSWGEAEFSADDDPPAVHVESSSGENGKTAVNASPASEVASRLFPSIVTGIERRQQTLPDTVQAETSEPTKESHSETPQNTLPNVGVSADHPATKRAQSVVDRMTAMKNGTQSAMT